jgi:hypothetical protein
MTKWPRQRRIDALVLTALAAVFVLGCNELPAEPIDVHNQSEQTIVIVRLVATGESVVARVLPGDRFTGENCIEPDLQVRPEDGSVVGTRAGPFCEGDPSWVITQAQVDAASTDN